MSVPTAELVRVFGRIGLLSFGGPAAQIALMHRELVERKQWVSERDFLSALSFCMLLPGPEAMQLATYTGWQLRGRVGGLIGGGLFVLPGAIVVFALAFIYAKFGTHPLVQAGFLGIKATIVVIVIQALFKLAAKALDRRAKWGLAVVSFLCLFVFALPFPFLICGAAFIGMLAFAPQAGDIPQRPKARTSLHVLWIGGLIWALPIAVAWAANAQLLVEIGAFFSKLAVVTFGGAYAVLAYMTQTVVQENGWLSTQQMIDALGLAETTPGPLILVTQFVAVLSGMLEGGTKLALLAGLMALWVTFVPCFIWIFAAAPYLRWVTAQPRLRGALDGITAAVVGVIANLALWFALHVFFRDLNTFSTGQLQVLWPDIASLDLVAAGLAVLAAGLIVAARVPMLPVLGIMALAGCMMSLI